MSDPLTVLTAQCRQLLELIGGFTEADWDRPTRCPPMSVRELVVHLAQAATGTAVLAATDMSGREPNVDRATWWVSPYRRPADDILANAQQTAAGLDGPSAAAFATEEIENMLATIGARQPGDVVGSEQRIVRAKELAGSRVLEFGVHTMDLGHATLRGERITPDAADFVSSILRTLLDEPLPTGMGWDERTFILSGTGRRELEPNERFALGALASKFPLLR